LIEENPFLVVCYFFSETQSFHVMWGSCVKDFSPVIFQVECDHITTLNLILSFAVRETFFVTRYYGGVRF